MLNPCDICRHNARINMLQSEKESYKELVRKIEQIYARAPVGIQAYLLLEFRKEGIVKQGGKDDAS